MNVFVGPNSANIDVSFFFFFNVFINQSVKPGAALLFVGNHPGIQGQHKCIFF